MVGPLGLGLWWGGGGPGGHPAGMHSAPAGGLAGSGVDALDAVLRLVRHELDAGVEEVETGTGLRLRAVLRELGDRLDALGGHLQRVLLGGRPDDAVLDVADAGAATVDRDDRDALLL